jgi:hypothetical protein
MQLVFNEAYLEKSQKVHSLGGSATLGRVHEHVALAFSAKTMDDPVQYLHLVRETLSHQDYLRFCRLMADYKSNRSCIDDIVAEALKIFGDNVELKKGFQIFLPKDYSSTFDLESQTVVEARGTECDSLQESDEREGLLRQREIRGSNVKFFLVCTGIWLSVLSLVIYGLIKFILI